jgi:drug/metabolite transporter (DMT)-like permease
MNVRSALAAVLTLVLWASTFAGLRYALSVFKPMELAMFRFGVAAIAMLFYAIATRMRLPDPRDLPAIFLIAITGVTIYHLSLNFGMLTVSAGASSLLISTAPVFLVLLAAIFMHEKLTRLTIAGMIVSTIGAVLISFGKNGAMEFNSGAMLVLIAALSGAIYSLGQKKLLPKYGAAALTSYCVWIGTLFFLPALPETIRAIKEVTWQPIATVIYLGIFPTAVAYITWAYVLKVFPAARAGSILYLMPVLAILIAWLTIHEIPAPISLIGGVLALAGVILINWRTRQPEIPVEG